MNSLLFDSFSVIVTVAELIVILFLLYYYYISVGGWRKREEVKDYTPTKRFALVTAAHNEEAVIRYHLESLKSLNYPAEMFDIYVIADNCTDNTASIARQEGVTVCERFSPQRGKGYALEWMFAKLFAMEDQQYDAVCIFDADNVVSSNFLLEMNSKLKQGYRSIQGYLDTKNPTDSWVSACYATAYWSMNRMWQLARYNRNLSSALGGTGVCLDYNLLKEYGWGATCLTEDLEFTMKLLLNGIKTSWAHEAKVYDEKPVYFSQTWRQRTRWLSGHWDVCFRFFGPLMKKGIKERKWYPIDGAIYLFQPVMVTLAFTAVTFSIINFFSPVPIYLSGLTKLAPTWAWWLFGIIGYAYPMLGLILEGAPRRAYYYYITYPFYGLTWFPVTIWGLLKHKNQDEWAHTEHSRGISIDSLEGVAPAATAVAMTEEPEQSEEIDRHASLAPYATLVTQEYQPNRESEIDTESRAEKPTYPKLVVNKSTTLLKPVEVAKNTINQDNCPPVTATEVKAAR